MTNTPVQTRVASRSDIPVIDDILNRSYPETMAAAYPPAMLEQLLPIICHANTRLIRAGTFYVAERGETPLGCGGWSPERPGTNQRESGVAHIRHFATVADAIGKGVGRALFRRCLQDVRALGFESFEVYATFNAEGFYAAMGFKAIGQINIPMPGNVPAPAIHMHRLI